MTRRIPAEVDIYRRITLDVSIRAALITSADLLVVVKPANLDPIFVVAENWIKGPISLIVLRKREEFSYDLILKGGLPRKWQG